MRPLHGSREGKIQANRPTRPRRLSRVESRGIPRPRPRLEEHQDPPRGPRRHGRLDGAPRPGRRGARGEQGAGGGCQTRGWRPGRRRQKRRLRVPDDGVQGWRRGRVEAPRTHQRFAP